MIPLMVSASPKMVRMGELRRLAQRNLEQLMDKKHQKVFLKRAENKEDMKEHIECSICMEEMNDNNCSLQKCGHFYHKTCILEWKKRSTTCPYCRRDL